jgi:hypothetical protein
VRRTNSNYFNALKVMNKKAADHFSPLRKANGALLRSAQ